MGSQHFHILRVITLLAFFTCVLSQECKVKCMKGKSYAGELKLGECACSPNYPGNYPHKSHCTVKMIVNNHKRIRINAPVFKLRQTKQGHREFLLFENTINKKMNKKIDKKTKKPKGGYYMSKVWQKKKNPLVIINSPQVRMKFSARGKGSTKNRKWKVCLEDNYSPNAYKLNCPSFAMTNMKRGFNRRHADISSNATTVTEFCCKSTGFNMKDDEAFVMCEEGGFPKKEITQNNKQTCVICSESRERAAVQADVPNPNGKRVDCTCELRPGVQIGVDCTGGLPCLDLNGHAFCDEAGDNTCKCPPGMVSDPDKTMCGPPAKLGEDCSAGQVCHTTYGRGFCDGSVCVCPDTEAADATDMFCTKAVDIGAPCKEGYTCNDIFSRATCVSDVCTCPAPMSPATNNSYCTYNSNYKGPCEHVLDCVYTRSKQCNMATNLCECESPFQDLRGLCSYKSPHGGICESVIDCDVTNSLCSGGKCACKNNYRKISSTVCSPFCRHYASSGTKTLHNVGKVLCNKNGQLCYKCKCTGPGAMTVLKKSSREYRSGKNACYTKLTSACSSVPKLKSTRSKCGI